MKTPISVRVSQNASLLRRGAALFVALLVLASCSTIRSTPRAFDTGQVLEPGETRFAASTSMIYFIPIPGEVQIDRGFYGGWEASLGWGIHGTIEGEGDKNTQTLSGPELYIAKSIISFRDLLYVSLNAGTDINIIPDVDALLRAGVSAGIFPVPWFGVFGNAGITYITASEAVAPIGGLGVQLGNQLYARAAGYLVPEQESDTTDFLWPIYYGLQVGFKIDS